MVVSSQSHPTARAEPDDPPNNALNPSVLRVTALAQYGKRRAARPAR